MPHRRYLVKLVASMKQVKRLRFYSVANCFGEEKGNWYDVASGSPFSRARQRRSMPDMASIRAETRNQFNFLVT
jgi:hypothetical protein